MKSTNNKRSVTTRASPSSDDKSEGTAANARAYPPSDGNVTRAHTQVPKIRIASWNVGSMTGRSAELSEVLHRRRINICCIQETKWKGSKSRNIGHNYKLIYHGTRSQNGVGIVVDHDFQDRIVEVNRISERLISIKFALDNQPCMNIICAYAPQTGCSNAEKETFWNEINDLLQSIPATESKYIGGDLNGHVGSRTFTYQRIHGNWGYGNINPEGENILQFALTHDLAIVNTFFSKRPEHLVTYKSGGACTQIDYILTDRHRLKTFRDCKVIPGEPLTSQHRVLVAEFEMPKPIKVKKRKDHPDTLAQTGTGRGAKDV
ncbi:craniofacial development protein 2-like [Helicoverpa zea]|uniref:craniofacial development protein 2-like n=1 Tax=Helicoverpa zea TaxID=7113 RepID=UPI001F5878BE|nr:craniofacial development protein 2-like [Helicoverpa zea]